jgi:nucleoporin SEH1
MQIDSEDYLQDISFDYYGNRMAVCSSDRKIRIYEKNDKDEGWDQIALWEVIIITFILGT